MKFRQLISRITKKFSKKLFVSLATVAVIAGAGLQASAEFYPARPTYDYNKGSDTSNCADPNDPGYSYGRCGSLTGPVFNSFINTPSYGDERSFADARRSDESITSYKDTVTNVTDGSKEVVIRTYVHNNAHQSLNAGGSGVAVNTKVRVALPPATSNGLRARSYITADNASTVEDTVDFTSNRNFSLQYVPGSAKLYNNGVFSAGTPISDTVVTTGALIGDDALDGNLPGCFEFASVVEIRVKITAVDFTKEVRIKGDTAWTKSVAVKPGQRVEWLMSFQNVGSTDLSSVNMSDKLPPHLSVVPGSVKYIDAAQTVTQTDTQFFTTGGIGFGPWLPNGGFYVTFETVANSDFTECSVLLRNIAYNQTAQTPRTEDSADIRITKDNCVPTTPTYSCDLFTLSFVDRKANVSFKPNGQNGATFKDATVKYNADGVNKETIVFNAVNGEGKIVSSHTFAEAEKNVEAVATVRFNVVENGQTVVKEVVCKDSKVLGLKTPPTDKPKTLPNTGPGSIAGLMAVVTIAGTLAHRRYTLKNNR